MQGQRYWVERAFEDGKGECGLADYQALGWRSWHHHVTMVMLAMLFILEQRVAQQPGLELLTPRDIVEMLKETLPRKPEGREALVARINERHERRRGAIESRFRTQHIPLPHSTQKGSGIDKAVASECDSVKLTNPPLQPAAPQSPACQFASSSESASRPPPAPDSASDGIMTGAHSGPRYGRAGGRGRNGCRLR